jgi:hypothetical protein
MEFAKKKGGSAPGTEPPKGRMEIKMPATAQWLQKNIIIPHCSVSNNY